MQWFVFKEPGKTYTIKSGEISYMCYDEDKNMTDIVLTGGPWVKIAGNVTKQIKEALKNKYQDVFMVVEKDK